MGVGALVVYERNEHVGQNISAGCGSKEQREEAKANIVERIVNGYPLFAAVFPGLKPGTYDVSGPNAHASVTVFSGQVAEMDWRKKLSWQEENRLEEKAKQRREAQAPLRVKSVMIGLGGDLLLAHQYMMIPYVDTIGICLMGLGVVNIVSSAILDWLDWLQGSDGKGFRFDFL